MLKPTGTRLIVKPDAPETRSGSIIFPETYGKPPAMTGTVVSVGRGPASAHRVRQATIAHCIQLLNEVAERVPSAALRGEIEDELARYAVEDVRLSDVSTGDYICFAFTAGHKLTVDDQPFIVLEEGDVQAVWAREKEAVA